MKLALVDLDGVLANDTHRVQFAIDRNWTEYFDIFRMGADSPWPQGMELIEGLLRQNTHQIAYLTGRRSAMREVTEAWLQKHGFPFARVIMREPVWHKDGLLQETPVWPEARLADFKLGVLQKLLLSKGVDDVVLFEDDPEVVNTIQRALGSERAVLCTWSVKPEAMVKLATA